VDDSSLQVKSDVLPNNQWLAVDPSESPKWPEIKRTLPLERLTGSCFEIKLGERVTVP
jgi:hypothetical protein